MAYAANIDDEFTTLLGNVVNVAVLVVIFLLIVGLGWFVASWLRTWLTRLLQRVGFDRVVERGGLARAIGMRSPSNLAARLVFFAVLLFVLQIAFSIFGPNAVSDLIRSIIAWLPKLFVAVIIMIVAAAVAGWVKELVVSTLGPLSYGRAIAVAAQVVILALGGVAALSQIWVATTVTVPVWIAVLATVSGIAIVGVGGGLIKPMQSRWERMLSRAEAETATAADTMRAHRAAAGEPSPESGAKERGFAQPPYASGQRTDRKNVPAEPAAERPTAELRPPVEPS